MKRLKHSILNSLALGVCIQLSPQIAYAQDSTTPQMAWEICNETSFILRVASATQQGEGVEAKGWLKLYPGQCQTQIIDLNIQRFVYAESSPAHQGGIREWKGSTKLCAGESNFTSTADMSCALQNMSTKPYLAIPNQDAKTSLTEPTNYGTKKSETAGLQRLLKENGYTLRKIDGLSGRKTTGLISAFLKDNSLAKNTVTQDIFTALETKALDTQSSIGLTVCNSSSHMIWVATAKKAGTNWESKGWWAANTGECVQPFNEALTGKNLHFYAVQNNIPEGINPDDAGDTDTSNTDTNDTSQQDYPISTKAKETFCISQSRFNALGRQSCEIQGYETARFRAITTEKKGLRVELTDKDFPKSNLR